MYVQRSMQLLQLVTGCEQKNTLYCYNWTPPSAGADVERPEATADFGDTVLRMREESGCCIRFCIGSLRPFRMAVYPYSKNANFPPKDMDPFGLPNAVTLERPFRLPILCCFRPLLRVRHNTLGYVAQIRNPFTFLHWHFDVLAPDAEGEPGVPVVLPKGAAPGQLLYKVRGSICQGGMCFPNCPCICKRVMFNIYAPEDTAFANPIGEVNRVFRDCCKSVLLEMDSFSAQFPEGISPEIRVAILSCTVLMETQLFEDPENKGFLGALLKS